MADKQIFKRLFFCGNIYTIDNILIQIFANPKHFAKHCEKQDLENSSPCPHGTQSREDGKK